MGIATLLLAASAKHDGLVEGPETRVGIATLTVSSGARGLKLLSKGLKPARGLRHLGARVEKIMRKIHSRRALNPRGDCDHHSSSFAAARAAFRAKGLKPTWGLRQQRHCLKDRVQVFVEGPETRVGIATL